MTCPICGFAIPPDAVSCPRCGAAAHPSESRPPSSGVAVEVCRVCGNPLGGKSTCEMCGAPAVAATAAATGLRCPICGGELGDDLSCPKCGRITGRGIEEERAGFRCPRCGRDVDLKDDTCASCGLKIWLDQEAESTKLDSFRCPSCGSPIVETDEMCGQCGFRVQMESEEERALRARSAIGTAEASIVAASESAGFDPERATTYLEGARRMLEAGDVDNAWRRALAASEIAETTSRQIGILEEAVRRAEERMRSAEDSGGDVAGCRELLGLSRQAAAKGDRKVAVRLALKSKIMAEGIEESLRRAPLGP